MQILMQLVYICQFVLVYMSTFVFLNSRDSVSYFTVTDTLYNLRTWKKVGRWRGREQGNSKDIIWTLASLTLDGIACQTLGNSSF